MSRQEGWMRRVELVVLVVAAVAIAAGYTISRLFDW
jgi:hypothetical protein